MDSGDTNSINSVSFKRVRLPPLGSPSQKLGIESLASSGILLLTKIQFSPI
jgi:hypothetical protein